MTNNMMDAFGVTDEFQMRRRVEQLQLEIAMVKGGEKMEDDASAFVNGVANGKNAVITRVAKNHQPSTAHVGRVYVRLTDSLGGGGCIPQQQADIASILIKGMEKGARYSEEYVFSLVNEQGVNYQQLRTSKQATDYLFRYYRGLNKKDNKHLGFIIRGFLQQLG
jgi:hypothetical protein